MIHITFRQHIFPHKEVFEWQRHLNIPKCHCKAQHVFCYVICRLGSVRVRQALSVIERKCVISGFKQNVVNQRAEGRRRVLRLYN